MKKVLLSLFMISGLAMTTPLFAQGGFNFDDITEAPYEEVFDEKGGEEAVDLGQVFKDDAIDPDDSASEQIQEAFNVNFEGDQRATFYIKEIINWMLAILGLVALIVVIFGFYKMFTNQDNEERYKEARKILIVAVIAIVVIGVARFLTSWFFDVFFQVRDDI